MTITSESVREIFKGLENGDGAAFFEHVADNVDWVVEGTHPLAGHYLSKKAFIEGTFTKLGKVLPQGAQLHIENVIVQDNQAVVELHSLATAKNGMRFDNRYCWVVYFKGGENSRAYGNLVRSFALWKLCSCPERAGFARSPVAWCRRTKNRSGCEEFS
jgi:ketosteroid isomerase-like protein